MYCLQSLQSQSTYFNHVSRLKTFLSIRTFCGLELSYFQAKIRMSYGTCFEVKDIFIDSHVLRAGAFIFSSENSNELRNLF